MPVADGFTFFAAAALKSARERSRVTTLAEVPPLAAVRSGPARRAGTCWRRLVSVGVSWCRLVSVGVSWCRLVSVCCGGVVVHVVRAVYTVVTMRVCGFGVQLVEQTPFYKIRSLVAIRTDLAGVRPNSVVLQSFLGPTATVQPLS